MSVDKLDDDWTAKPTSWFYPSANQSTTDEVTVDLKGKLTPVLMPWPGYGDFTDETRHDENNHLSPISQGAFNSLSFSHLSIFFLKMCSMFISGYHN